MSTLGRQRASVSATKKNSFKSPVRQKSPAARQRQVLTNDISLKSQLEESILREKANSIELDRLKTTCKTLNNKANIVDQLHSEVEMLRKRLEDAENTANERGT
jgi:outer membrane murein-binding lipoprotein Lpp